MSLRLPKSLHERARKLARQEGVSINQLIATALAEKLATIDTLDYLKTRADKGSRQEFADILSRVPDVPPDPGDELPAEPG